MIYLDYSAHTWVSDDVIDTWVKINRRFIGNANSIHSLGSDARLFLDEAVDKTAKLLKVNSEDLIFTSGASESNNTVIKGIRRYKNRGKKIITSSFEHSSIYAPLHELIDEGYEVIIIPSTDDSPFDMEMFQKEMTDDVVLVTTTYVASETGCILPVDEIKAVVKNYPKCYYHVDATQALGKINIDLKDIDFASFSAHKIFGPLGIGLLYKKKDIAISSLISGGKSQSKYRSGTPDIANIGAFYKAMDNALYDLPVKLDYVVDLNKYLRKALSEIDGIFINSREDGLPHILNISFLKMKPEVFLHFLEKENIYISTQTACSGKSDYSKAIFELTKSMKQAEHSVRISLSHLTTTDELDTLIEVIKNA